MSNERRVDPEVLKAVMGITAGVPAGVADVMSAVARGNLDQLTNELVRLGLPEDESKRETWWSDNWRKVRRFSVKELMNNLPYDGK